MGRIRNDTLTQIHRNGNRARVSCAGCGHAVDWDAMELAKLAVANRLPVDIDRLAPRLKCGQCGEKQARIVPILGNW